MLDSEVETLRWLVDSVRRREAAQDLVPEIEALLNRSDDEIQRFFAETLDGLTFVCPAEARSWLQMFRAFLTWNSKRMMHPQGAGWASGSLAEIKRVSTLPQAAQRERVIFQNLICMHE
jgi:hypothetical protein